MISAISSAQAGMARASNWMDAVARQVNTDTSFTTSAVAAAIVGAASAPAVASNAGEGLVDTMPNLMMAGILFQANASVARQAEETYRSVLELGRSGE
jgi:hypothetical protein